MKKVKVLLLLSIGVMWCMTATATSSLLTASSFNYSEEEVRNRIQKSSHILAENYESAVNYFVKDNLYYGRKGFKKTLARTQIYFPVIEEYLRFYRLPDDLKHMVVVESQANPHAKSPVGAIGLWQLMPQTARRFGLIVNSRQDDRKDPRKATEAALRYLHYLYNFFGKEWDLAIAAYNCGEGRVKQAISKANSTQFEKVKYYLPKQTKKYIPAIIAAGYSVNYHWLHGVAPGRVDYAMKFSKAVKVYDRLSFAEIANITNTSIAIIRKLNPSYHRGFVPASRKGNYVVLPATCINQLSQYLQYSNRYFVRA